MSNSKKNIVVPVDFSDQSLLALEQSYSIARMIGADITLLHIIVETSPFWGIFNAKEQKDVTEKFKHKLDDFAEIVTKKTGIKVNTIIKQGKLIEKIIETCDKLDARFLIVGTIVKDNIREKILGSNSTKLVSHSKCPVITIKGKQTTGKCGKIVLPLDFEKETKQKVKHAISVAQYFQSTVHIISVTSSKDSHLCDRLMLQMEQVKKFINQQRITCVTDFKKIKASDNIAKSLLNYSYEIGADLLMIMTSQEDVVTEFFLGTTAKEIINNSDIPVMSITPK